MYDTFFFQLLIYSIKILHIATWWTDIQRVSKILKKFEIGYSSPSLHVYCKSITFCFRALVTMWLFRTVHRFYHFPVNVSISRLFGWHNGRLVFMFSFFYFFIFFYWSHFFSLVDGFSLARYRFVSLFHFEWKYETSWHEKPIQSDVRVEW